VCVCERERKRERDRAHNSHAYMCIHLCVCVYSGGVSVNDAKFSLPGTLPLRFHRRRAAYEFLLSFMQDEHRFNTVIKLCEDVLQVHKGILNAVVVLRCSKCWVSTLYMVILFMRIRMHMHIFFLQVHLLSPRQSQAHTQDSACAMSAVKDAFVILCSSEIRLKGVKKTTVGFVCVCM
jgi:hypothetical protein